MLTGKRLVLSILFVIASVSVAWAEIKLDTQISDSNLILGDEITFQLKIDGAQDGVKLGFPKINGLSIRQLGTPSSSSQTTIINGKVSHFSGLTFNIGISAEKTGDYVIPGIQVEYQNQTYSGRGFRLKVVAPDQQSKMKVLTEVSSHEIYLHEPLEITLKWCLQDNVEDYAFRFPLLDRKDEIKLELVEREGSGTSTSISVNNYKVPFQQNTEEIDGTHYTVYKTRFRVYPTEAGTFKIPAANVKAMIKHGTEMRRDFFGRTVRSPKLKSIFATSGVLETQVRSLPEAGRPSTFTGGVGNFSIQLATDASRVKVGDPVEISIRIVGTGRLDQIEQPILTEIPEYARNFVIVDNLQPGDIQEDSILFKQVIRPRHEKITRIPSVVFSYFNPAAGGYTTIESNSLPLKVLPTRKVSAADIVVHGSKQNVAVTSFIKQKRGIYANYTFEDALKSQTRSWNWFLLLILPPLVYFLILTLVSRQKRLRNDLATLRARSAKGTKNKRLKKARKLIEAEGAEFLQELTRTLTGFVSDKLNLGTGELTTIDLKELGSRNQLPAELAAEITLCLEKLDRLRFTNQKSTNEEKQSLFDEVDGIMKVLAKRLR